MWYRILLDYLEVIIRGLLIIINGMQDNKELAESFNRYAEKTMNFRKAIKDDD